MDYSNSSNTKLIHDIDRIIQRLKDLKLPQMHNDQEISILMDGQQAPAENTKIAMDGKTMKIDIFIPPEEHKLQILGVARTTA
jgi:hypothetical protein